MSAIKNNLSIRAKKDPDSGKVYMQLTYFARAGQKVVESYEVNDLSDGPAILAAVREVLTKNATGYIWA